MRTSAVVLGIARSPDAERPQSRSARLDADEHKNTARDACACDKVEGFLTAER